MTTLNLTPPTLPLSVFYDGNCPLCHAEMEAIASLNRQGALNLVNCAAPDFDRNLFLHEGITHEAMMKAMHVRDASGRWWSGPDAFAQMYEQVDQKTIAKFWGSSFLRPVTQRLYPLIANNRQTLSALGADKLFSVFTRRMARQANARFERQHKTCADNSCQVPQKGDSNE
jgi:predicted DCC family thiol-disulfide oxidoreductase YuxK